MSNIRHFSGPGVPGPSQDPTDAQAEQNAAASGQIQPGGMQSKVPVGSAAPAQGTSGAKDGVAQTGSMTAAHRTVLGAFTTSQLGPDLPNTSNSANKTPAQRLAQLKSDAAVLSTLIPQAGSSMSDAEMFTIVGKALNSSSQIFAAVERAAGQGSVNAKEQEVSDQIKEIHGERVHAAEQLGASIGTAVTQMGMVGEGARKVSGIDRGAMFGRFGRSGSSADSGGPAAADRGDKASSVSEEATGTDIAQRNTEETSNISTANMQRVQKRDSAHSTSEHYLSNTKSEKSLESSNSDDTRTLQSEKSFESLPKNQQSTVQPKQVQTSFNTPSSAVRRSSIVKPQPETDFKGGFLGESPSESPKTEVSQQSKQLMSFSTPHDGDGSVDGPSKNSSPNLSGEVWGEMLKASGQAVGSVLQNSADYIDKMAGGQHEADEAKIAQKQDQVMSQVAQNTHDSSKSSKEQAWDAVKNLFQLVTSYIQRHQDMMNQIGQR